jgi:sugar phosphate isomerase/epimerase
MPSRREFLTHAAAATAVAGACASDAVPAPTSQPRSPRPRVGCLSWCFHPFSARADQERAIEVIGELGFDGIELILIARSDIKEYWTDDRISQMVKQLARHKLAVSQFVLFQPVVEGLTSLDAAVRSENLDYFEGGCKIAKKLGAPMVNIVAPWARELKGPSTYLPRYYEIEKPKPGEKFHIDIAAGFDWEQVWDAYVQSTKACLERAKLHGLRFSIEHHTHTLVPDSASFLRLWEAIRDPALGCTLDSGWLMTQREYPPLAIHKLKKHLFNVHVRDIDGLMRRFVHVGEGVMDFKHIAQTLKSIGYTGFASIEQDKHPGDMLATCKRYLEMMRGYWA